MGLWEDMLEVSRVGVAEIDEEIELSLELSIGGSYGKCEKSTRLIEEPLSRENGRAVARPGFAFSEAEQVEGESTGSVPEAVDPSRKREIQALRRLEARRKREEKMRKSSVSFRGVNANYDKVGLEAQQFEDRAQCRKLREDENFLDDKSGRKKEKESAKIANCVAMNMDETAIQNHGVIQLKKGFLHPYEMKKETYTFQPTVACGSFRPYVNGTGDNNVRQNSGAGFHSRIVNQNVVSNGSLERSSSDYPSNSGKGGSISDSGSHSGGLQGKERQISGNNASSDVLNQPHHQGMGVPATESECVTDITSAISKATSNPENSASSPANATTKQSSEVSDSPWKKGGMQYLSQMPCVSTTGNGPNGKTVTGFLYRYTKAEVSIVCVCHGSSFSPAEFVEHAGGTDISNPLRHITVVPSSIG